MYLISYFFDNIINMDNLLTNYTRRTTGILHNCLVFRTSGAVLRFVLYL